jgi:hypothetical protein
MSEKGPGESVEDFVVHTSINEASGAGGGTDGSGEVGLLESRLEAKLAPIRKDILAIRMSVSVILRKLDTR